jgi:hypothetical protein
MARMRALMLSLPLLFVVAGCDEDEAAGGDTDPAVQAAERWLEIVDRGDYASSWTEAASYFRGAVPQAQWEQQVAGVRRPLGGVESRTMSSATPATTLPGAPDGSYVVIEFHTSFANKANAVETVTPMREEDGSWRVSGYYIR